MSESFLDLESWPEGITAARIPANNNVRTMEAFIGPAISATTTAQPGSPAERDVYIIPAAATGAQWSAFTEGSVAIYFDATWTEFEPFEGLRKTVLDEGTDGENWQYLAGAWAAEAGGGGGGSPGGSDTQVQFNDAGSFGGDAGLAYNKTTDTLTLVNATYTGLALTAATTTSSAGLRLPHGTAPSAPVNGDVWTTTAGMYVRVNGVTVGPLSAGGGGGLTGFTSSLETASPNNTVNASLIIASGGTTNQDAVFQAKGTGAILGQKPDGTTAGGNKRGSNAVDFQSTRASATQIALGTNSAIVNGSNNSIGSGATRSFVGAGNTNAVGSSTTDSAIVGGSNNVMGGNNGFIGAGDSNNVSGQYGACPAGNSNTVSGQAAGVTNGQSNTADAGYSRAGGRHSNVRSIFGGDAYANGNFAAIGDAQKFNLCLRAATTNNTTTTLTSDAGAASANNQVALPANALCVIRGLVGGRQQSTGDSAAWEFVAAFKKGANNAATALLGAATVTPVGTPDAGASTWTVAIIADTTNGAMNIRVTGENSKSIRWNAAITSMQVAG